MVEKAKEYRMRLVEAAVELDDTAMEAYLEGNEPDEATLKRLIRKAVLNASFFPILAASAFKNKGVQTLLMRSSTICRRRSIARRSRAPT